MMNGEDDNNLAFNALENLRKRLLNLTANNRLINFKHTKNRSLRIIDELPDQLVETLLSETQMRFLPVPEPSRDELLEAGYIKIDEKTEQEIKLRKDPTAEEWAKWLGLDTSYEVPDTSGEDPDDKHTDTAIQTLLFPYEMEARLKSLRQTAESAIQEMGANILYIAFGFLEWFENDDGKARIAPLFLVPVRIQKGHLNRKTQTYEYKLSYSGEDIIPNLSLREKLRVDFALVLPDLDDKTEPEAYFNNVLAVIEKNKPNWRLRRFISLGLLNFNKLLMYLDLDPSRWPEDSNILDHPVVSSFLAGYNADQVDENNGNGDLGFGEEYLIDELEDIHEKYPIIDDADSSQHSALIDAIDGKNLVIEGPPGTGKSQTITNLIAAALSQGKRVLFVAEKLAALEVVARRLDAAGLGEFCLELHSHKSQKRKVLDEIEIRLKKKGSYRRPEDIDVEIVRYEELKTVLKYHAERINRFWKNTGMSLHEILMAATRYREVLDINPQRLHPEGFTGDNFDTVTQRRTYDQVEAFRKVYQAIASQNTELAAISEHPWFGVRNADLQIFDLDRIFKALEGWQESLQKLQSDRTRIIEVFGGNADEFPGSLKGMSELLEDLEKIPTLKGNELLDRLPILHGERLEKVHRYLKLFEGIQSYYQTLEGKVGAEILQDLPKVKNLLIGSKQLSQLVGESIQMGTVAEAIDRLILMQAQLHELEEPLNQVQQVAGEGAAQFFILNKSGLSEFKIFIDLVHDLDSSYWKLRDELFDNEELDDLLPKLRNELEQLRSLSEELAVVFRMESLPDENKLRQLKKTLDMGGVFRRLKGGWRAARDEVLDYSVESQNKITQIHPFLGKAIEFVERKNKFDQNQLYKEALGVHLNGLDTDLTALESLRGWYRNIRMEYGQGFGKKVPLGDAIINLQTNLARAVRSLHEQAVPRKISDLLEDLVSLREIFSPVEEFRKDTAILSGEKGTISCLLTSLNEAIRNCGSMIADDSLTTEELADLVNMLGILHKYVSNWTKADYDNRFFEGRLGLKLGLKVDNSTSLSIMQNTLAIADSLEKDVKSEALRQCIYNQPNSSNFSNFYKVAEELRITVDNEIANSKSFSQLVALDMEDWTKESVDNIDRLISRSEKALNNTDSLQNLLDYIRVRNQVAAMGLNKLVESVEQDVIKIQEVENAHKAGVFDLLAREILREQPEIGRFLGREQETVQDSFIKYDNHLKKLQSEKIAWHVDQNQIPMGNRGGRVSEYTQLHLLEHECSKKARHLPIRQLLHRSTHALVALKPCFMMGPMSVAQYLAPGQVEFDLVIMDEASQIKPQDALGAIARGAKLVVVGDPKQLPPTNFFDRVVDSDNEEDDQTTLEESESILDATLPMFPAKRLRWHYRSQHESLIAFSNQSFYDSDLVIFPSPHKASDNYGIQYSRIRRGCFVNRINMEEARIISEAVKEHFKHRPDESIGVVAMNAQQRLQIESAIEALAKEDMFFQEALEKDSNNEESLFIKNLENVQGDERDVIFISMTYGPQEPGGKVFQRFGPINSNMGWRRLNVLFTRSKKRMHIFSSMGSEDIIVGSTANRGKQALRDFLSYCETGILHKTEIDTGKPPDSDFEVAVMAALRDAGFECKPQVGVAGFFIDLAVVDPGNPGRFLMGIECDGATYHSAKSARDRDRLRQEILERLGWEIRRIWSTDWFKNPHAELQPIIRELNSLKSERVESYNSEIESENDQIEEIVKEVEEKISISESYISEETDLRAKLLEFDREVVRKSLPETPDNQRLLRPSMLEAFLEYLPISKSEFLQYMPPYLRKSTHASEGEFLENILEIINLNAKEERV